MLQNKWKLNIDCEFSSFDALRVALGKIKRDIEQAQRNVRETGDGYEYSYLIYSTIKEQPKETAIETISIKPQEKIIDGVKHLIVPSKLNFT